MLFYVLKGFGSGISHCIPLILKVLCLCLSQVSLFFVSPQTLLLGIILIPLSGVHRLFAQANKFGRLMKIFYTSWKVSIMTSSPALNPIAFNNSTVWSSLIVYTRLPYSEDSLKFSIHPRKLRKRATSFDLHWFYGILWSTGLD